MTLPFPQDTQYAALQDASYNAFLSAIEQAIKGNLFKIEDKRHYESVANQNRINEAIGQFGWRIQRCWVGSQDDGYCVIEIKPKIRMPTNNLKC